MELKGAKNLQDEAVRQQIRLGIQGYPFVGKTWSAVTFPKPVVLNIDNKLGAHSGKDIIDIPFYDAKFVDSIYPRTDKQSPPNKREAIKKWLGTEATKIEADYTLIIDSLTMWQTAVNTQARVEPFYTKQGKIDDYGPHRFKIEYFEECFDLIKTLACHVILVCHETPEWKAGEPTGKLRPLLSGQYAHRLAGDFTDWFRQHAIEKPTEQKKERLAKKMGVSVKELESICNNTEGDTLRLWQTQPDDEADCGTSLKNVPRFISANYESYKQFVPQTGH